MTISSLATRCAAALPALALLLAGCSGRKDDEKAKPPVTVGYVVVREGSVPLSVELPGRITAVETSDVRPQVSGVVYRRFFAEGSLVRKGQKLYEIDPSLYRAAAAQARANLASAAATAEARSIQARRLKPLADLEAVSRQDYTDAAAAARSAEAAVAQNRAALDTANVNLRFTNVPAPITGRIGRSLFTVGALVTGNQTEPLAQITQLDPLFVDIQQSAADLLALRRSLAKGGVVPATAEVRLLLEDGSEYQRTGRVAFTEAIVDPSTGTVTLRATFANPDNLLLPGMFVRARFAQAVDSKVLLVPQQAVSRDPTGRANVYVVDGKGRIAIRQVAATRTVGQDWVVTGGIRAGERVVTQGLGSLTPGQQVKAVPASQAQRVGPPTNAGQKDQGGGARAGGGGGGSTGSGG